MRADGLDDARSMTPAPIRIVTTRMEAEVLAGYVGNPHEGMVKFVADIAQGILALGGELHADAELLLLDAGSNQSDLWGGNYHPGRGEAECIEYTSLINIRPSQGNRSLEIGSGATRTRVREIVHRLLGRGEALP